MSRALNQPNILPSISSLSNLSNLHNTSNTCSPELYIESTGFEEAMFPSSSYAQCALHLTTKRNKSISHLLKSAPHYCRLCQLAELPIRQSSRRAVGTIELCQMQLLHNQLSPRKVKFSAACVSDPPQNLALGLDGTREIL